MAYFGLLFVVVVVVSDTFNENKMQIELVAMSSLCACACVYLNRNKGCHCTDDIEFFTYVVSFCLIKSQIRRIDGQSGSKRKCEQATSVHRKMSKINNNIGINNERNENNQNECTNIHAHAHISKVKVLHKISHF